MHGDSPPDSALRSMSERQQEENHVSQSLISIPAGHFQPCGDDVIDYTLSDSGGAP